MKRKLSIKFVKEDCWIGVYWKNIYSHITEYRGPATAKVKNNRWIRTQQKIYICIVPCFPIIIERTWGY